MRANRAFLGRVVRFLAGQAGVRQFLDIGSGIPTENAVHQVAQDTAPGSRVVYVDNNDVAVAHSRLLLDGNPDAAVIQGDLREPAKILADPGTQLLLDFTQPVAVFLVAVLHFIPDTDQPADIIATLRDALAPGSYLVICHACRDEQPGLATSFETVYNNRVTAQLNMRSRDEITQSVRRFHPHRTRPGLDTPNGGPTPPTTFPRTRPSTGPWSASPATTARRPPRQPRTDRSATDQAGI